MDQDKQANQQLPPIREAESFQRLWETIKQKGGRITHKEMLTLPKGTRVRIKKKAQQKEEWSGELIFQEAKNVDNDEQRYGIIWDNNVCFTFQASDYEILAPPQTF